MENNWFNRLMASLGLSVRVDVVNKADDVRVEVHREEPSVPEELKPKYLDFQEVEKLVNARQVERKIMLRGRLFEFVRATIDHSAMGGNGQLMHMYKLVHMGPGWSGMEPDDVPEEFWPQSEADIERPSDWIDHIDTLNDLDWKMRTMWQRLHAFFTAHPKAQVVHFVMWNETLMPVLKIYEDLSWIDIGWKGPVIVVTEGVGDRRLPETIGIIPDQSGLATISDFYAQLVAFRDGKLQEFPDTYEDKARYIQYLAEFTTYLDQQSISYQ